MRLKAQCAALAVFLTASVAGCAPAPPAPPVPGPALWLASDADSRIWLLGTVHVLPKALRWRSAAIDAALKEADLLVLEVDPDLTADAKAAADFAAAFDAAGRNPAGVTLSSLLTAADRDALAKAAEKAGVRVADLEAYRPWMASVRLTYAALGKQGVTADAGVEGVLTADARARGLRVDGLESLDQQIGFFRQLTPEVELAALRQTLADVMKGDDTIALIDTLWANGDADGLAARLLPDFKMPGDQFYRVFLADRNEAWADEIVRRMQGSGDVFVAVGAAHMAGPDGLPALLRARGVKVAGP